MQVNLGSGNYSIIANGETFLFHPYDDLTLEVNNGVENLLRIILHFQDDPSGERSIKTNIIDDAMVITCINFNGSGTGLKQPSHIANINGKSVYLIFVSNYFGDAEEPNRIVRYTIFMEK